MLQGQLWSLNYNLSLRYMDDSALVAGLQCGDREAVEHLVRQYAPALYRLSYYQLHDATLAEDLVSDVLVRVMGSIDRFVVGQATFQAWLFRIARNLIADHYRARNRHPQLSLEVMLNTD